MINIIKQSAKFVLPIALSSLTQASSLDSRIGKIVSGIGLTLSGMSLLTSCNEQNCSKPSWRWGATLTAAAITCYGLASITMGIFELTCTERLEIAKKELLSCPEAQKLWDEVESQGPFTIRYARPDEEILSAQTILDEREIIIAEKAPKMVPSMLFELNNIKRAKEFSKVSDNPLKFEMEEYVRAVEELEYGSAKDTYTISKSCVDNGFWRENLRHFQKEFDGDNAPWKTFEQCLKTQEKTGHTKLYQSQWLVKCWPFLRNQGEFVLPPGGIKKSDCF